MGNKATKVSDKAFIMQLLLQLLSTEYTSRMLIQETEGYRICLFEHGQFYCCAFIIVIVN